MRVCQFRHLGYGGEYSLQDGRMQKDARQTPAADSCGENDGICLP
jgi:hypothetical protein